MKKNRKKLSLQRETLRRLEDQHVGQAAGGNFSFDCVTGLRTWRCTDPLFCTDDTNCTAFACPSVVC